MTDLFKICPRCGSARPASEMACEAEDTGDVCGYSLFDVPLASAPGAAAASATAGGDAAVVEAPPAPPAAVPTAVCPNGHPAEPGDLMCIVCGELIHAALNGTLSLGQQAAEGAAAKGPELDETDHGTREPERFAGWLLLSHLDGAPAGREWRMAARNVDGPTEAILKRYPAGHRTDPVVIEALAWIPRDNVVGLIESGEEDGAPYEAWEAPRHARLSDLSASDLGPRLAHAAAACIGGALSQIETAGIRHLGIRSEVIHVEDLDPPALRLDGFESARMSGFDLSAAGRPGAEDRYSAPELLAGTSSVSSDWWSLGIVLLEILTARTCFGGVGDRAILLSHVTRGVHIPDDLPDGFPPLLKGLLTRDPERRWRWGEVRRWLEGDTRIPYVDESAPTTAAEGPALSLLGREHRSPESYALAAASDAAAWDEASSALARGGIATWLDERAEDAAMIAAVRRAAQNDRLDPDARLALALMAMNPDLPLCRRGDILGPQQLMENPAAAHEWLSSHLPARLAAMGRAPWFVRLSERTERVRTRIADLQIPVDEETLSIALLASSTSGLAAEWSTRRVLFPESDHAGLSALIEKRSLTDEDLIILVSARTEAFRTADEIMGEAEQLAQQAGLSFFDAETTRSMFAEGWRGILDALATRLRDFARCGRPLIDEWADAFRLERRIPLTRALVLLAVQETEWKPPTGQRYIQNVLGFFRRRLTADIQQGPLVRMTIARTSARVDLYDLGTPIKPAEQILGQILQRERILTEIDPAALLADHSREQRLRRLGQAAETHRRDTGIDALYIGFPLLVMGPRRSDGNRRPRVAPILLWPVKLEAATGRRGIVRIGFDGDREEVRLNPAFEAMLGAEKAQRWQSAADDLLTGSRIGISEVMDAFADLAETEDRKLVPVPPTDLQVPAGSMRLRCSAAFFLCDFSGHTIAEDLRNLAGRPVNGTALATAIRIEQPPDPALSPKVQQANRYLAVEADPSQHEAVLRARMAPGLVIQGPPGTGKSQTIVNVIADCIGRGERVLVVCQKPAALEVVRKRLEAAGLGSRLFHLQNTTSDRQPMLRALREQLDSVGTLAPLAARVASRRSALAERIESIETDIDRHGEALGRLDETTGFSYRDIIVSLIDLERGPRPPVDAPAIRPVLAPMRPEVVDHIASTCAPLAALWLEARYEDSPLAALKPCADDPGLISVIEAALDRMLAAERARAKILEMNPDGPEIDDPAPLETWLAEHGAALASMPENVARDLAALKDLFRVQRGGSTRGAELRAALEQLMATLDGLDPEAHHHRLSPALAGLSDPELRRLRKATERVKASLGFWLATLNPMHHARQRRVAAFLEAADTVLDLETLHDLLIAMALERELRPARAAFEEIVDRLGPVLPGCSANPKASLPRLKDACLTVLTALIDVQTAADRVQAYPGPDDATEVLRRGTADAFAKWLRGCRDAMARHAAKKRSTEAVDAAAPYFEDKWIADRRACIAGRRDGLQPLLAISAGRGHLAAYQRFRSRVSGLPSEALFVFAGLRRHEDAWRRVEPTLLPAEVKRTILRESRLAWKHAAETAEPLLLMERREIEEKVHSLAQLESDRGALEREYLAVNVRMDRITSRRAWDDIVMLTGPRARRLREVVDRGEEMGLFDLRPVWLVNPEMVSRLFPLRAGLFDVAIFDEASQMPVEAALPALFRARRAVVSGDEKQLPPTRFFSRTEAAEDEEPATTADDGDAEAQVRLEEAWNRREVKDCDDLLALGRAVLPSAMLEIHYRSAHRELIAFSNTAYYGGRLSIPVHHPEQETLRAKPIEVIRVDTPYVSQTNEGEARAVVALLRDLWLDSGPRPSVGVVTFNLKQAELIQDRLEEAAEADPALADALTAERARRQAGEDMSFFVRNLESVQGDERDRIIFSTTFGPDRFSVFRRSFGALGQQGGERRLNVAVTRAREKVIVVTSLPTAQISDFMTSASGPVRARDYLQAYIAYVEAVSEGRLDAAQTLLTRFGMDARPGRGVPASSGSDRTGFILEVAEFLRDQGYEPVPGRDDDVFAVDLAIEDPHTGLFGIAIECDPPSHPLLTTARARDVWRPQVLSRSVPKVHRVWSRLWYHNRADERARLMAAVCAALGGGT